MFDCSFCGGKHKRRESCRVRDFKVIDRVLYGKEPSALIVCNQILDWASDKSWFNTDFVMSIKNKIESGECVSDKVFFALVKIKFKFDIK